MYKYFSDSEFKKCNPSCSIEDMDSEFMKLLDKLREMAGIPLVLNCAYRSKEYDLMKNRSGNSGHTRGKAVDIRCFDSQNRFKIISNAIELGITRIGIGEGFIHLDNDSTLPQNVIWYYY